MADSFTYAVVTPARDEAPNLERLARALAAQTLSPTAWVIVDNGSTDDTREIADEIARRDSSVAVRGVSRVADDARGAPVVQAFHAGLECLQAEVDVIVKLDADISFEPDHFERLIAAFADDATLGIAAGTCYEQDPDRIWRQRHSTGIGIRGACRAYRRECLAQMLPLEERLGWDTLDLVKAKVNGWTTRVIDDLPFLHHRPWGARERTARERWSGQGEAAYYMGYRLSYLLARTLYKSLRQLSALGLLEGYLRARVRRTKRCADPDVIAFIRRQQSLRSMPERVREAVRRRKPLTKTA